MGELKKTFLAGLMVLGILLLAPYYLQLIGYNDQNDAVETSVLEEPVVPPIQTPVEIQNNPQTFSAGYSSTEGGKAGEEIVVYAPLYTAKVSSFGGGSFNYYALNEYRGSWGSGGDYIDSLDVTLVSEDRLGCAPCVAVPTEQQFPQTIREAFDCSTSLGWRNNKEFNLGEGESLVVVCSLEAEGTKIVKTTTFDGSSFVVNHNVRAFPGSGSGPVETLSLVWDKGIDNTEKNLYDDISYSSASVSFQEEITTHSFIPKTLNDKLEESFWHTGSVDWLAMRNKYFILAMISEDPKWTQGGIEGGTRQLVSGSFAPVYKLSFSNGNDVGFSINSYLGPLDIDQINKLDTTLDRIMNFGWFIIQPFSRGILWLLKFFHSFGINYGVILILFAFLVRIITGPLTKKSFASTQKMQAIQPQLKKLQEKYKSDPQKLNTETVKLYRDNGVNPMGGCWPMLLQMPLLFALFMVFRSTIEFRGASFFWWIKDLSQPDTVFNLPFYIPVYGDQVAFLPILLGISMFLTQKMSMANMGSAGGQQKYMMYFMSVFFFLLFNSFPSGLNLYYLIYNILNYLQQRSLKKA